MLLAMENRYACAIEGPYGTGKTETVKDLSRTLARSIHVINTSADLDYTEIVKFFKGVTSSGSWVLFDELNRMETGMMNFITQIVSQIQNAVRSHISYIMVEDQKAMIDTEAAIFVTLNPGYKGRQELPHSLKSLFRPLSMVVPNLELITEIMLSRSGFYQAYDLSKKMSHIQKQAGVLIKQ
jgi:dynein heavy chain, axonemal